MSQQDTQTDTVTVPDTTIRPDLEPVETDLATGEFVITIACDDRPGIVHAVTGFLVEHGGNILESGQFNDQAARRFFLRIHFETPGATPDVEDQRESFSAIAEQYGMTYELWDARARYRTLIMASKFLHCLNDLLFRCSVGALNIDIPVVVSNHRDAEALVHSYGLEFIHIPVTKDTKEAAERRLLDLVAEREIHVVVLARYMQVLSDELCQLLSGQIINIHHSFLPSFKGAKPYHQAHDRGVKLIGATAHYVTADLDEGPIIEQDVERVTHAYNQDQLVAVGRDVECQVLSRALKWHSETRVLMNGNRTIVFN